MLDRIKNVLMNHKNISGYKICETRTEANELFFIKKKVDMDRAKSVLQYKVTVYIDYEENETRYLGASSTSIYPTMSDAEIEEVITEAAFAAKFVKNPYYPLAKAVPCYKPMKESNFSKESLPYWMNEITKAVYKNDIYEKGGINSCEIFLNKVDMRIVNSEGVDAHSVEYKGMIEFITTWKEEGEEIELYRCLNCSEFSAEKIAEEVEGMITICKEKAIAKSTPTVGKCPVILTREAVRDLFSYYYSKSHASSVYNETSTWKLGEKIQGAEVKGDLITMTLDPYMDNSVYSRAFDEDGYPLEAVTILEKGILQRYAADTRYAYYLNVTPTGTINNIIVNGGRYTTADLRKGTYLEVAAFSDFYVDKMTGDFCGEIRLAWVFDGKESRPVTGGSITGNINELQEELYFSQELQKDNNFEGPEIVKLMNVTVAGVE
jgi:PmbA protein